MCNYVIVWRIFGEETHIKTIKVEGPDAFSCLRISEMAMKKTTDNTLELISMTLVNK